MAALIGVLALGIAAPSSRAQTCFPAPAGLVSWWQAEGDPTDAVGGNDASIIGNVTYAAGEVGQAFSLDGNHSGLTLGSPANLQLQDFTIDAWVQRGSITKASLDTGGGVLFGYGLSGYQFGMSDNGKLFLANVGNAAVSSTVQVTDTAWHHLAVTKNGSTVVFYLDGVANPAPAFSTTFLFSSAVNIGSLQIGGLKNSFLGMIDELDVFDHALSATEVQGIVNAGDFGKCTGNTPPTILTQPTSQTTVVGGAVVFSVTAAGSQPISYQWQLNGSNLPAATNPKLTLSSAKTSDAGSYSVTVSSPFGSVTSDNALLTVNPAPVCAPAPSGLVSWWQGEGNANDIVGGNNGTPVANVTFTNGEVGQAFKLDGNQSGITVGNPVNLQVQDFTIDAWINRGSATQTSVEPGGGIVFSYGNGGYQFGILDDGRPFLSTVGAPGQLVIGTVQVTGTAWHHVAVTKTGSSVVFYLDGGANSVAAFGPASFQFTTTATIGAVLVGSFLHNTFLGSIDELDIFNRALSTAEVQSIFNTGTAGKCPGPPQITVQPVAQATVVGNTASFSVTASGSAPLSYHWQLNGTALTGATSPTLNLVNVQTANAGNYSVIVSNPGGSITSASALLTVNPAGLCIPAPSGLVSWWQGEGTASDIVGGNNGVVIGTVAYAAGEVGQAFSFNGNHSELNLGTPASLQLQNFTIDAWIKRGSAAQASLDAGGGVLFGFGVGGYQLGIFDNGHPFMANVGNAFTASGLSVTGTGWHHVAVTKTGATVVFYLDGVADAPQSFSQTFQFNNPAAIGGLESDGPQNTFLGLIDELDVFNRALSTAEIQSIFNIGSGGKCTGNTPPAITSQPAGQTTVAGGSASFTVTATGSQPLSYQWQLNGANVNGATSATLNLVNLQNANAGNYSVVVSSPYGTVTSANALLTVNPLVCVPPPSGLVSWWQAEGNANDFVGGNSGTVVGNVTYAPGEVGQAFSLDGNHSGLTVGNPANLQVQNFTIDAWVKRASATQSSLDAGGGIVFSYGSGGYQLGILDDGRPFLSQVGTSGQLVIATVQVTGTAWHHVAVTKNGSVLVFYLDGVANPTPGMTVVFGFNTSATIGAVPNGGSLQNSFLGLLDEVDVFNRALSASEVAGIFNATIAGKCTGNTPPAITAQPANQTTVAGNTASFSVTASGSQPLSYQWQLNGANVNGATSATLNLVNLQNANAGNYSVIVSSPYGTVTSANALLTVTPLTCVLAPAGLVGWWQGEGNATDFAGGNNGTIGGNVTFAAGEVGQAFSLDGNHSGITVGNTANLQLQNFTIDAWIKRGSATKASQDTGGGVVFGYGTGGYQFAIFDSGQMFLDQVGTPGQIVTSTFNVTDTAWHHVAVTKNSLVVVFYLDGVAFPAAPMSVGFTFTTPPNIGAQGAGLQNSFLGSLDEVDVFSRALSAVEVQSIYNTKTVGKCGANTPPMITGQPVNQTTVIGNTVSFSVMVGGSQPFTYQWRFNGSNLAGATSQTLTLVNVQAANAGNYSVIIGNPFGSATSAGAILTVNGTGSCSPAPSGLVAWWQGDGSATDLVAGNNGTLTGNVTFAAGEVGQAFSLDGNGSGITVGNAGNLQLQDFTIDAWVKRGSATKASLDAGGGAVFGYGSGGYQFAMSDNGQMFLDQVGTPGQVVTSTVQVADTAWHHIAVTKTGLTVTFYLDGVANLAPPMGVQFGFTTSPAIGALPTGGGVVNSFLGLLDEVDVFNRALSAPEVQSIYNSGIGGKCMGNTAPVIIVQPTGQTTIAGNKVSFSVTAIGSSPLGYQWRLNGVNLPGATSSTLTLPSVQVADSGNYSVVVSNPNGSVPSANALLAVNPLICTPPPSGLVSWWQAEGTPGDFVGGNNGTVVGNVTYAPGKVGQAFSLNGNGSGLTVGNPANLQLQNFTIDAWVKRGSATQASLDRSGGVLFGYGSGGYQLGMFDNGQMFLEAVGGGFVGSTIQVPDTAWHHIAATKTGSTVVFYVDGVANPVAAFNVTFQFTSTAAIGGLVDSSLHNSFLGLIDELDIFNRALSAAEVQSIFSVGIAGKCNGNVPPTITVQPSGRTILTGHPVSFSVTAAGSQPLSFQWRLNGFNLLGATSATLNLVNPQVADSGNYTVVVSSPYGSVTSANALLTVLPPPPCTPAPSALVSWWQAEGNASDFVGNNTGTIVGNVTYAPGKVGQAFNLDGGSSGITIGNPANLQLQNFTIDAWVKRASATQASLSGGGGIVISYGTGGYQVGILDNGQIFLSQVNVGGQLAESTVQVADTEWHHVAVTKNGTVVVFYLDGVANPASAYNAVFAFGSTAIIGAIPNGGSVQNGFLGLLDEVDVFSRALSAAEVQAIYNADSGGKCPVPPSIVTQPASQIVTVGGNGTFTVIAAGTPPLTYQWTFGGANIPGATSNSLTLTNVQFNQAGSYSVVVANGSGSVTSTPAALTVVLPPAQLQIATVSHAPGIITIPINLTAQGDENALGFSINYDKTLLTFSDAIVGSGASGASMFVNTSLTGSGQLGIALSLPFNTSFAQGTHELVEVSFTTAPVTKTTVTAITFGDQPILRQVSNPQAMVEPAVYTEGGITITFPGYEADVSPRPNGDNSLTIVDWVQVGRFVAGLDTISSPSEFQKADCAPRATLGDGALSVADWVQAGRYVAGLDPLTYAGGPTTPTPMRITGGPQQVFTQNSLFRTLTAMNSTAQAGQACQVPIRLSSQGNENGLEFSVVFDPAALSFTGATVGDGATGANLFVNTGQAASGKIGVLLALPPGSHFAAATLQVAKLNFMAAASAGGNSSISFVAQPLPQQVVDTTASDLPTTYISGTVAITPIASPVLTATYANSGIILSWPASAAGFNLESNPDPSSTNWSSVTSTLVTNATTITTTNPVSGSQMFFRLHHP